MSYSIFLECFTDFSPVQLSGDINKWLTSSSANDLASNLIGQIGVTHSSDSMIVKCPLCSCEYIPNTLIAIQLRSGEDFTGVIIGSCQLAAFITRLIDGMAVLSTQNGELISYFCHETGVINANFSISGDISKEMPWMSMSYLNDL